jgi:glucans biosynthesis protein C
MITAKTAPSTASTDPGRSRVTARRRDLDWLRIGAVLLLIPFHCARVFDTFDPFYVKNSIRSGVLSWSVIAFLNPWHMPLLFVLAGAATWFALGHRSASGYATERVKRLLVPLAFGLLVIVPPQAFLARMFRGGDFSLGQYWSFQGNLTGYTGNWTPAHLWFIAFLFVFSLLMLPLFVRWRRGRMSARWLLFAMPLVLVLANELPSSNDGAQSPWYSLALFVAGFLIVADPRAEDMIHRSWKPLVATAVGTMATVLSVYHSGVDATWANNSLRDVSFTMLEQANAWVWVLALLGAGHALLDRGNRVLRYASEGAYPFYLLHQTVIVAVAFVVVRWDLGVWPKYGVLVIVSLAITLGLYELLVRRSDRMRFLFGLKPRQIFRRETGNTTDDERTGLPTSDPRSSARWPPTSKGRSDMDGTLWPADSVWVGR